MLRLACVQMNARDDMAANIEAASKLVREAASAGAQFVSLPEYVSLMDGRSKVMLAGAHPEATHPALAAFRALARDCAMTLHVGSLTVSGAQDKPVNRGFLILPDGNIAARYDKINMFDITLPDGREVFESRVYAPGNQAVLAETPGLRAGMSICYDVRFPALYRALAEAGAELLLVPAAFLPSTGKDHWHALLKSRAIDNGCFLAAAALCGEHGGNRASYGHSLILDPWGRVLAEAGEEPGFIMADLDLSLAAKMRAQNPWLKQPAGFTPPARKKEE